MSTDIVRAIRYGYENNEPTWAWEAGRWEIGAGFYRGLSLGFSWMPGEWDVYLGPFMVGGVRRPSNSPTEDTTE